MVLRGLYGVGLVVKGVCMVRALRYSYCATYIASLLSQALARPLNSGQFRISVAVPAARGAHYAGRPS